jgi:predicted nucleotidyltransferase
VTHEAEKQLDAIVDGLRETFGDALIGVYLHGSAALGCFGPRSDLDVVASIERPSSADEKRRLGALWKSLAEELHLLDSGASVVGAERVRQLALELARRRQLLGDVGAADQLALDEYLRDRRPARERL